MKIANIGIIGTGNISDIYCENLCTVHENTNVLACADVNLEAAKAKAEKWGIPQVMTVDELLSNPDIDIVVNLTPPKFHFEISRRALLAGKHVYTEKPLGMTTREADILMDLAREKGLLLGCAPETPWGAAVSTAKALIDQGAIGKVLYADARFRGPGDENWHPNPAFLYQPGAGPLFDRGPYFLNDLVYLLGKVDSVFAMHAIGFPTRTITSEPKKGEVFKVETPSHVQGLMRFASGVMVSTLFSFDMRCPYDSAIEIFGTEGSILIDKPIAFGVPVKLCKNCGEYEEVPHVNDRTNNIRGYAVSCMAQCLAEGRTDHPAAGSIGRHVVEIMEKYMLSAENGQMYTIDSQP